MPPVHPGEVLLEEFLRPMGISQYRLVRDISVPPRRINEIVHTEVEKDRLAGRLDAEVTPLSSDHLAPAQP